MTTVTSLNDVPKGPHWAIISTESTTIPGDERSRVAPGHGYPEHTKTFVTYQAFIGEEEFKKAVELRLQSASRSRREFICIHVDKTTTPEIRAKIDWGA